MGTTKFAVAAAIRARQASMLASAAERSSSSVSRARATLVTILDGILAKKKVRCCCCQRNVRNRGGSAVSCKVRNGECEKWKRKKERGGQELGLWGLYSWWRQK